MYALVHLEFTSLKELEKGRMPISIMILFGHKAYFQGFVALILFQILLLVAFPHIVLYPTLCCHIMYVGVTSTYALENSVII